jgi:hypothetical protein
VLTIFSPTIPSIPNAPQRKDNPTPLPLPLQLFVSSRGVQNNRLTEKTDKTEEKLTEKTEPK